MSVCVGWGGCELAIYTLDDGVSNACDLRWVWMSDAGDMTWAVDHGENIEWLTVWYTTALHLHISML